MEAICGKKGDEENRKESAETNGSAGSYDDAARPPDSWKIVPVLACSR
jgi:hypothetical protein